MKKTIYVSIALMFAVAISKAQIPNASFESWTTMAGYSNPDSWSCLNDMTAPMSVYTCTKGTPGSPGNAYLKLTSKAIPGLGVVNGMAVCGVLNTTTMQPVSGFAFNQRPASFTGKWQHMIFGSSQGYIDVQLTRWDAMSQSRVIVSSKHQVLSGMAMSWATFTIPLTYMDGGNPDSCIITLSASGTVPTDNDYLWVDNLSFSGTVTGISTIDANSKISLFPNPAFEFVSVDLSALKGNKVSLEILNVEGKVLKSFKDVIVVSNYTISIADLPKGNYTLNVTAEKGAIQKSFIKQ